MKTLYRRENEFAGTCVVVVEMENPIFEGEKLWLYFDGEVGGVYTVLTSEEEVEKLISELKKEEGDQA